MTPSNNRVICVVGARPQFVKLGPVSRALRAEGIDEVVLHTGQHHDVAMSQQFFEELHLPEPDVNLGIHGNGPLHQMGAMIPALGEVFDRVDPALILVFGDTTSTVAATLAASYRGLPTAHVEAGMRAFDPYMPEEIARVVTDRLSRLWFTASEAAEANLAREQLAPTHFVGDVMYDVVLDAAPLLAARGDILVQYGVQTGSFALATVHRARNTDEPDRLRRIVDLFCELPLPIIFPVHPRTVQALRRHGLIERLEKADHVVMTGPLRYLETLTLASAARRVFTDSGGLQKEAFYLGTPCTTLREETEWVETVDLGWNVLTGADTGLGLASLEQTPPPQPSRQPYGDGKAGVAVARHVRRWLDEAGA